MTDVTHGRKETDISAAYTALLYSRAVKNNNRLA